MGGNPSGGASSGGARCWAFAGAIALGVHAAWWLTLPPFPQRGAVRAPPAPRVSYLAAPDASDNTDALRTDVRLLWSPLLFALPSTLGYSESVLDTRIAFGPPARAATPPPYLASRRDAGVPATSPAENDTLASLSRAAVLTLPLRAPAPPAFAPRSASSNAVLHIAWTDASGKSQYASIDVGRADPWVDAKSWQAGAVLDIAEDGSVRHVFLEEPTAVKDRNAALVRQLFTLRLGPGDERTCRVAVRCEGTLAAGGGEAR